MTSSSFSSAGLPGELRARWSRRPSVIDHLGADGHAALGHHGAHAGAAQRDGHGALLQHVAAGEEPVLARPAPARGEAAHHDRGARARR